MGEPRLDLESGLVDLTGVDLAELSRLEDSVLKESLARLKQEAGQADQAAAGFSSSI